MAALSGPDARDGAMRRALRHSARVRLLKRVLPLAALALIGGFAGLALLARLPSGAEVASVALEDGRIVMEAPRLNGLTADNRPYVLQAARAFQLIANPDDIKLEGITAEVPFGAGANARMQAASGHLDNGRRTLALAGGLTFTTTDGLTGRLEEADIDIAASTLVSRRPVVIGNDRLSISADGMEVIDGARILVFEKRVRMMLTPSAMQGAPAGQPADATGAP